MAENYTTISLSIPPDLNTFLEHEAIRCNTKKSCIMQEELYNRKERVKNEGKDKIFFPLILLLMGLSLLCFSIFLIPIMFIAFFALGILGLVSLLTGYVGIYAIFKEKRLVKG